MGTSNSTAMLSYPVDPEDFIYQTPSANKNQIYVKRKKRSKKLKSSEAPSAAKSKVCRKLEYKSTVTKRAAAGGVPHQWQPRSGQLRDIWCRPKKRRKRVLMVFNRPIAFLQSVR
jgi:hypothetical protein